MSIKVMRAFPLLFISTSIWALPPVTEEEAIRFHENGLCQMVTPGNGINRADGDGWIVSSLPGAHRLYVKSGKVSKQMIDFMPGKPVQITITPNTAVLQWCPAFKPGGRDECGTVPKAFLYDSTKIND